jgi:TPR repeat protein
MQLRDRKARILPQDRPTAIRYLNESADRRNASGRYNDGVALRGGKHVSADLIEVAQYAIGQVSRELSWTVQPWHGFAEPEDASADVRELMSVTAFQRTLFGHQKPESLSYYYKNSADISGKATGCIQQCHQGKSSVRTKSRQKNDQDLKTPITTHDLTR